MSSVTTAVVLARGLGTRMRREQVANARPEQLAAADAGAKALMPIGQHVLADFIVSALADAGITKVIMVVPPDYDAFAAHFTGRQLARVSVAFAVQAEPRGTADALAAARAAVGDAPFVAVNGDNFYPVHAIAAVSAADSHAMGGFDADSLVEGGNIPRERLPRFAFAWADAAGRMQRFVEKPDVSPIGDPGARVSMNLWRFGPRIFDACARVTPSVRGELELVDAVRMLPDALGEPVFVVPVRGPVLDLSSREDIAAVEQLLASHEVRL